MNIEYKSLVRNLKDTTIKINKLNTNISDNEVLIKIDYAGICRTDIFVSNGKIKIDKEIVLGHEFSGYIFKAHRSSKFKEGDYVTVNPIFDDNSMLGLEHSGCFSEYINVDEKSVYKINIPEDNRVSAYIEPLAASLAPLKSKLITKEMKGAVYGENRIGQLTYLIMKKNGYEIELISENSEIKKNHYNYIIETLPTKETFDFIAKALKQNGILILKSRLRDYVEINLYNFLKKEITIESLYYHDFDFAIEYAINNFKDFIFLFGNEYSIDNWKEAFNESITGDKKIFFKF